MSNNHLDPQEIIEKAYSQCVRESRRPWDLSDHAAVALAFVIAYLRHPKWKVGVNTVSGVEGLCKALEEIHGY